jgi:glycosyltransferase involved in cell wall biosynthesis
MIRTNLKIAFVHNSYIEYRTPFFDKVSLHFNTRFFFERYDSSLARDKPAFMFRFLRSLKINGNYSFSPLLFFHLLNGKYQVFVAGAIGELNTYITFFVSRLLRKPFIFWDENWCWPCNKWKRLVWPFILYTIKNSEAILVPGSKSKDFYLKINPTLKNRIFVAPNVSLLPQNQTIKLKANRFRTTLKLQDKKVVLFCGRLIKQKGFNYLVKAVAKLQEHSAKIFLLIVGGQYGSGERYSIDELITFQRTFGDDKIHFTGWVESTEKAAYFLLADVVVVPSIFYVGGSEVWGFAVNESMSVGKPVIATRAVGSAYDLIQNGKNGYIVPDKDPEALSKAISLILEDSCKSQTMGEVSLGIIQEGFKYENMLVGFEQAIKFALDASLTK